MKWLCGASLVISFIAGFIALRTDLNAEQTAMRAVQVRERKLVDNLWPQVQRVYADIGEPESAPSERPESVEGLLEPLLQALQVR